MIRSASERSVEAEQEVAVCLIPDCHRPATTRGLCDSCYSAAYLTVRSGAVTWDMLIDLGLALRRQLDGRKHKYCRGPFLRALELALGARERRPVQESMSRNAIPCVECGQVDDGQCGTDPCQECGVPTVWTKPPRRFAHAK